MRNTTSIDSIRRVCCRNIPGGTPEADSKVEAGFCGAWHDKTVFRRNLKNRLLPNEKAEADVGYIGDSKCRIPQDYLSLEELSMKEEARGRHESANRLFKCFGILRKQFRGALNKHRNVCYACGVIIQLCLSEGTDSLFDLDYSI